MTLEVSGDEVECDGIALKVINEQRKEKDDCCVSNPPQTEHSPSTKGCFQFAFKVYFY